VLAAGGVVVGLDAHAPSSQISDIALRCDLAGLVIQDGSMLELLGNDLRARLKFVISVNPSPLAGIATLDQICDEECSAVASELPSIDPDDPATIVFTSGTTGGPKGIQYTHRQIILAVASMLHAFPDIDEGGRLACWLPLSNLFQRMLNTCAVARGAQTYYVDDPQQIMRHVQTIEPDVFIGVPRFFEKLYAGII
jgi:long-chain acyl-CoA synthetase